MDSSYTKVKVLYNLKYMTRSNYCVSIKKSEELFLLEKTNNDWWKVKRHSDRPFYVPSNYVKETPQAPIRPSVSQKKNIPKEKPIVKKRTIFEMPLQSTSKNIPLKNNIVKSTNENYTSEKVICDINQDDVLNNKKVLSLASNYSNKTIISQDISGYYVVTTQNYDVNKEQSASLSSSSLEESPQRTEENSTSSNINKSDAREQKTLKFLSSLEELNQNNELKLKPSNKIVIISESNTVPDFTEVKNLQENINKLSLVSLENSTNVEKLNKKNKVNHICRFKTQHERNQWAKNMINKNKIEKSKLNDKE